jgi:N-acetylglucosaminyldiphosphoundecaprenol N-acetyl-beta-D-mannosaminyltransferase
MLRHYTIYRKQLNELPKGRQIIINTLNQYSFCIAEEDPLFKQALQKADVLLPDGVGITAAYRFLYKQPIRKIAGADLHQFFLEQLNHSGGSCFYMGSSDSTLQKIRERIRAAYPNIRIQTYSPPFKQEFSHEDNQTILDAINAFQPDVLFVGLTAPKQEKWVLLHKNQLNAGYICSIGAVFDFFAGTVERPSQIWIELGLEWLGRLLKEPKRMWRRYLYYGPVYAGHLLKEKFQKIESPN